MVCGKLPLEGNSMAQLMFRIVNEPHRFLTVRPDRHARQGQRKALAKKVGERI